jgi:acetylornithine deacetylase
MDISSKSTDTLELLKQLISIPSLSNNEDAVSDFLFDYIINKGFEPSRKGNNIWLRNKYFSTELPTILLNSHLDTVKPCDGWTTDPFTPFEIDGKLYGLGSNDAGLPLSSLFSVFQYFYSKESLGYNLIFAATAEEEISGKNGIQSILSEIGTIDLGIIGEPTNMKIAVAEKGLIVLDCYSLGIASHAAHAEQNNAILNCLDDLQWFKNYQFKKTSSLLGDTKTSVTQISAGKQHNVIPDKCHFVVDVRVNDKYTNQEVVDIIKDSIKSEVKPRSLRLNSSSIPEDHPIEKKGKEIGLDTFGSHTLSDQALLKFPSIKIGPGDSVRSHTADEYIYIDEIENGINTYINLLDGLKL